MLKLSYNVSAEQFGPAELLKFSMLAEEQLRGDDFERLGFSISSDLDTLRWSIMQTLAAIDGPTWCRLGDRDERSRRLKSGERLCEITDDLRRKPGVAARLLPMSDHPVCTRVQTLDGWIDFQDHFVRLRWSGGAFAGAECARSNSEVLAALRDPNLRAFVICPSNPLISIEPILAVPGIRAGLSQCAAPVIAVSPIIAGKAVKGPSTKMLTELGTAPSAAAVARGFVMDHADAADLPVLDMPAALAPTLMNTLEERDNLAQLVLDFAAGLARRRVAAGAMR